MMDGIGKPPDDELEVWRQTWLIEHAAGGGDKKRDDS